METLNLKKEFVQPTAISKRAVTIPLYLYATVLASISIMVGLVWDISWHTSIGRDGLLSPPHIAIYFGGILAGIFSGIKVLKISFFGSKQEKEESNKFWGIFYGSLGALFCIWGAIAMLTSAPFDDWWHNTYGLDVTILSPPHTVLLLGMITIQFGAMITVLAVKNRMKVKNIQDEGLKKELSLHFALASGFVLTMLFTIASQYLNRHDMHSSTFYIVSSLLFPLLLVAASRSAPNRWGATFAALVYTIFLMLMVWILPLFEAEPLLGPVLNPITHFQAFEFPLLIIFPAIGIDLITQKLGHKNSWLLSLLYAVVFLTVFLAFQWPFGNFLMSDAARNWIFGTESWYFGSDPTWEFRYAYADWMVSSGLELVKGLSIALGVGFLVSRLSIRWGKWMQNIMR
ncbi:hypothetical protein C9994_08675 [Marivirga lumbricoides]|uniref:Uncharacterized protein n=1 Tax=Marivirga lumbricoides TaxID=1046115 RepID=A0A2T4DQT0_9BACT|nr:hypothetical protein C9994_08675 [Marivirga lumbricoides]